MLVDKSAVMSELSKKWSSLADEEKQVWRVEASESSTWTDVPKKKLVRDLTQSINENVSEKKNIVVKLFVVFVYLSSRVYQHWGMKVILWF